MIDKEPFKRFYYTNIYNALHALNTDIKHLFIICSYALFWNLKKLPEPHIRFFELEEMVKAGKSHGWTADYKTGGKVLYSGNGIQEVPKVHTRIKTLNSDFNKAIKDHTMGTQNSSTAARKFLEVFDIHNKEEIDQNVSVGIEVARPETPEEAGTIWSLLNEKNNIFNYYAKFHKFPIMNLEEQNIKPNPDSGWGSRILEKRNPAGIL